MEVLLSQPAQPCLVKISPPKGENAISCLFSMVILYYGNMEILRSDTSPAQPRAFITFGQGGLLSNSCTVFAVQVSSQKLQVPVRAFIFLKPQWAFTLNMPEVSPVFQFLFYCKWCSVWRPQCFRLPVSETGSPKLAGNDHLSTQQG